jgi:hypothetical protein
VSDPWFGRIVNDTKVQADSLQSVPIEGVVEMELVELLHGGPEENYRPYLHLRGELTEAKPAVELPYGVSQLAYRRGGGIPVDAFYDFTKSQLSDLVNKGYFSAAFEVPEQMSGIPWTLPGKADFLVVAPELSDQPPLVFMSVHDQNSLELDEANSGYELTEYFPNFDDQAQTSTQSQPVADAPLEHQGSTIDVFSNLTFDEHRPVAPVAPQPVEEVLELRSAVPDGVFSRLVSEIESRQQATEVPVVDEDLEDEGVAPGSAEDVYLSLVSPGVEHVLSGAHVDEVKEGDLTEATAEVQATESFTGEEETDAAESGHVVVEDGFLDLTQPEPELTPLNLQFDETAGYDHRQANDRRAARIRAELELDETHESGDEAEPAL